MDFLSFEWNAAPPAENKLWSQTRADKHFFLGGGAWACAFFLRKHDNAIFRHWLVNFFRNFFYNFVRKISRKIHTPKTQNFVLPLSTIIEY